MTRSRPIIPYRSCPLQPVDIMNVSSSRPVKCGNFPTIFILGTQKAATTSLGALLALSSQTVMNNGRYGRASPQPGCCTSGGAVSCQGGETHYLNICTVEGAHHGPFGPCSAAEYANAFESGSDLKAVDTTPAYLGAPRAPSLLRSLMPASMLDGAKLIVVLREPASRMLSWHNHKRWDLLNVDALTVLRPASDGHSGDIHIRFCKDTCLLCTQGAAKSASGDFSPSFHADAACCLSKVELFGSAMNTSFLSVDSKPTDEANGGANPSPLLLGHYAIHLRRWQRAGWKRQQLLVLGMKELVSQPELPLAVHRFAGLPVPSHSLSHANRLAFAGKVTRMCCETWCALDAYYDPFNQALYDKLRADHEGGTGPDHPPAEEPLLEPFEPPECEPCPHEAAVTSGLSKQATERMELCMATHAPVTPPLPHRPSPCPPSQPQLPPPPPCPPSPPQPPPSSPNACPEPLSTVEVPPTGSWNVLHMILDDWSDSPSHLTPHLNRLATSGLTFEAAYAQMSHCVPSRSSFLSGRSPETTRVLGHNEYYMRKHHADYATTAPCGASWTSLPEHFWTQGWHVFGAGKM